MKRPKDALRATLDLQRDRMKHDPEGGWVRAEDYDTWRAYALALECQLKQADPAHMAILHSAMKYHQCLKNLGDK